MSNTEAFNQLLEQLKPLRLTAAQWADLNYAVKLDEDDEKLVSKSPDDIGDELEIQAKRINLEKTWFPNVLSQLEALGTKSL